MTLKLKNSIFLHIPKTAGIKITDLLISSCSETSFIGDKMYDAHCVPIGLEDFGFFCFVRHPAHFAHSLWNHRKKKKSNKLGKPWNWQRNELEQTCKSIKYDSFMQNIVDNPGIILRYFNSYILSKPKMRVGRKEFLINDLIKILDYYDEQFDENIIINSNKVLNKGNYKEEVSKGWIQQMEDSEKELMEYYDIHYLI